MAVDEAPEERVEAVAQGLDAAQVRELLTRNLDFGCHPQLNRVEDGSYELPLIGTESRLEELRRDGFELRMLPRADRRAYEVGSGDRFADEKAVPTGFGQKLNEPVRETDLL